MRGFASLWTISVCCIAPIAALAVAGNAHAAALPFTGALVVQIANLAPITALGSGTATVNGSGGLGHLNSLDLAGGTFATAVSIPSTDPGALPLRGLTANLENRSGSFNTSTNLGGPMAVSGTATVCIFFSCPIATANLVVPFTSGGVNGVGLGGAPITTTGAFPSTVVGGPWTTGIVTTMNAQGGALSLTGFIHGPASGGASSAAAASGVLQLVTPVQIFGPTGALAAVPAFGILTLHFVPEPGTLLLLTAGVVGLGVLGRNRMSRAHAR